VLKWLLIEEKIVSLHPLDKQAKCNSRPENGLKRKNGLHRPE
jgi:hypothetical protein